MKFMNKIILIIIFVLIIFGNIGCTTTDANAIVLTSCEKIAFVKADYSLSINQDIYTACGDGSQISKLTDDPAVDVMPSWSPDAEQIAFSSNRTGTSQIYMMNKNGSGQKQITYDNSNDWPVWLPDSKSIAFRTTNGNGLWWWRSINLENSVIQNLTEPSYDFFYQKLAWSPDGKQIAYMSMEEQKSRNDGSSQIHIRTIQDNSGKTLTENIWANILPVWSLDSQRIAFLSEMHGEYNVYALYIICNSDGTGLRQLTDASYSDIGVNFSWSSDGRTLAVGDTNLGEIKIIDITNRKSTDFLVTNDGETAFWPVWQP